MLLALISFTDKPSSLDLRLASRPQHLAYREIYEDRIVQAGALLDTDRHGLRRRADHRCARFCRRGGLAPKPIPTSTPACSKAWWFPALRHIRSRRARGDNYWLALEGEPDAFSWAQQVAHGVEPWTGVRSYQARDNLRAMRGGDRAFFYHSNEGREIVGVVEVSYGKFIRTRAQNWATGRAWTCGPVAPMPNPVRRWRRSRPIPHWRAWR